MKADRVAEPAQAGILKDKMTVINVGLEHFAEALHEQGVSVAHVQWSPHKQVSKDIQRLLGKIL